MWPTGLTSVAQRRKLLTACHHPDYEAEPPFAGAVFLTRGLVGFVNHVKEAAGHQGDHGVVVRERLAGPICDGTDTVLAAARLPADPEPYLRVRGGVD